MSKKELVEQSAQEVANTALKTIKPEQYVTAIYEPFNKRLAEAIKEVDGVKYVITTAEGLKKAKECRSLFSAIRIEADKERKARKEPLLAIGKLLESGNNKIEEGVQPYEDRFDFEIKFEEKRKEDEKAELLRVEEKRKSELQAKLDLIKNVPTQALGFTSAQTQEAIDELSIIVPDEESYQERFVEAEIIIEQTIQILKGMLEGKLAQEQLAEKQAKEKAEQEEANKDQLRIDAIKKKIQGIKDALVLAAEYDTPAQLVQLITQVGNVNLFEEEYQEFTAEAKKIKVIVLGALNRQYDAILAAIQPIVNVPEEPVEVEVDVSTEWHSCSGEEAGIHFGATEEPLKLSGETVEIRTVSVGYKPVADLQAAVVDHQPEIAAFFKTRDFTKAKENEYRAVLVEFIKFSVIYEKG